MPRRAAALLLTGPPAVSGCPPGVDPVAFARALAEDVADLISALPGLDPVVAVAVGQRALAEALTWPGTTLLELPAGGGPLPVLAALADRGYDHGAVLAPDAPDLPDLLVAKVFSALAGAPAAVVPAEPASAGLVVLGCRLPVPAWLRPDAADLDLPDAVERLRRAAPSRGDLVVARGWRRLRGPADLGLLDPDLEGWEATRALLSGR